jgi:hypothetical protein
VPSIGRTSALERAPPSGTRTVWSRTRRRGRPRVPPERTPRRRRVGKVRGIRSVRSDAGGCARPPCEGMVRDRTQGRDRTQRSLPSRHDAPARQQQWPSDATSRARQASAPVHAPRCRGAHCPSWPSDAPGEVRRPAIRCRSTPSRSACPRTPARGGGPADRRLDLDGGNSARCSTGRCSSSPSSRPTRSGTAAHPYA